MTNQDKQNPKMDWGFFAAVPRSIRTGYKDLTHADKWLYVCLKDLCGDKGMCYRTLISLAEETDMSTGKLSAAIPKLHEAGLIHAEKKRRSNNPTAKEVWHISIVDIWQENGKQHPTEKRSENERFDDNVHNLNENVHNLNENVHNLNDAPGKRSENERKRSNFGDRSNNSEATTNIEEITGKDSVSTSAIASAKPQEKKQPLLFEDNRKPKRDVPLTEKQQTWFDSVYCQFKKMVTVRPIVTESLRDAISILCETPQTQTLEGLNKLYDYARSQPFMQGKAIKPGNLTYYLNDWLQMEQLQAPAQSSGPKPRQLDPVVAHQREMARRFAPEHENVAV